LYLNILPLIYSKIYYYKILKVVRAYPYYAFYIQYEIVCEVSSSHFTINPQEAGPCSHPHPYRWGTLAGLDFSRVILFPSPTPKT
jgi:hypothetical protein